MSTSIVEHVIANPYDFERILETCGIEKIPRLGVDGNCLCPLHNDVTPSATVRWKQGLLFCQSGCGTIGALKLVEERISGIHSSAEAARWVEEFLGIENTTKNVSNTNVSNCTDTMSSERNKYPGLTVAEYAASRKLSKKTIDAFGLTDVETWFTPKAKGFEGGWYPTVLMPNERARARVRNEGRPLWAGKIRDGVQYNTYEQRVYNYKSWSTTETTIVVEGESDVHALFEREYYSAVGVPGTKYAALVAELNIQRPEKYPLDNVVVWFEGDKAALEMIREIATSLPNCKIAHGNKEFKDPCELHLDCETDEAFRKVFDARLAVAEPILEFLAAYDNPVTVKQDPDGPPVGGDPWKSFLPTNKEIRIPSVEVINVETFRRTPDGWSKVSLTQEGEEKVMELSTPYTFDKIIEVDGGQSLVQVSAPTTDGTWETKEFEQNKLLKSESLGEPFGFLGIFTYQKSRPEITRLNMLMLKELKKERRFERLSSGSGWIGTSGEFSGVTKKSANELVQKMFKSQKQGDAKKHRELIEPLISFDENSPTSHLIGALAIGTACAAPLLRPMNSKTAPVLFLHGLGGGGKTFLQEICASIWAGDEHWDAFFSSADMSVAGLHAKAVSAQDLPLIIDDVTQLQSKVGGNRNKSDGSVEEACNIGMRVFNRTAPSRSKRDGTLREGKEFASTAIFSAEVSLTSGTANITAGHLRRMIAVECKPISDRGLLAVEHRHILDGFERARDEHGGIVGQEIIRILKDVWHSDHFKKWYRELTSEARHLAETHGVEQTQASSISLICLGYALYLMATGISEDEARKKSFLLLTMSLIDGGIGTTNNEVIGVEQALEAIKDYATVNSYRLLNIGEGPDSRMHSLIGRWAKDKQPGKEQLCLLAKSMQDIENRYGVRKSAITALEESGIAKRRQIMFGSKRVWCTCFVMDYEPGLENEEAINGEDKYV